MTPTEAALRKALEHVRCIMAPCGECGTDDPCWACHVEQALAAPPHGKDAGEERERELLQHAELSREMYHAERVEKENARFQRDYLQDLIRTANDTLDIVAASPQDFVTHVLLLREERDELKARLTEAEGLLRSYLIPGRDEREDLDRDTAAFLRKPPEATP